MSDFLKKLSNRRVFAIDPATHSFAFCVADKSDGKTKIISSGKIFFKKSDGTSERLRTINAILPQLLQKHKPTHVVIEQTIYIQNPKTTVLLAYVVGGLWANSVNYKCEVQDIGPMTWKTWLGYKRVTKAEKDEWAKTMTKAEVNKKAKFERKNRVRVIVRSRIPELEEVDEDVMDAIAIGLWGVANL